MTHKYQITADFGVCLFSFLKAFDANIKPGIHSLANFHVPGHSPKKFDYG